MLQRSPSIRWEITNYLGVPAGDYTGLQRSPSIHWEITPPDMLYEKYPIAST
ncbi:hypothetical protein D3OALGA1CA_1510 [Olavius algarvensis associated proteobacterium Delta 3]|nr:hypothetical protein D3OALGA1CA_1510 [Olavius algarvensis associated proteobacterium Delta 3]